jgi:hypothetical protein
MAWPRRSTLARVVLLGAVLGVHLGTRLWTHQDTPPDQKHFWPSSYLVSLSLLSGHGFSYPLPVDACTEASVTDVQGRIPVTRRVPSGLPARVRSVTRIPSGSRHWPSISSSVSLRNLGAPEPGRTSGGRQ